MRSLLTILKNIMRKLENKTEMEKLWENASPNSTFNAQNITLNLAEYDAVMVQYFVVKKDTNGVNSLVVPIGEYGSMNIASSINRARTFQVLENKVIFNTAYYWSVYGQGALVDNTWLTPYRIYGVKGAQ